MSLETIRTWLRVPDKFERVFLSGFFVVLSVVALFFPYSGDDWAWGSSLGIFRLETLFINYNGRWAGNLAILLLTRIGPASRLAVAAVLTLTLFLILDLTDNRTRTGYLVVSALFLAMPLGVWVESVVWLSGFANYALAGVFLLAYGRLIKRDLAHGEPARGPFAYLGISVFGIASALFVEHVTIFLVVAGIAYVVAYRVRFRRWARGGLCLAASFCAGALLMFSNGAYHAAVSARPGYQAIQTGAARSLAIKIMDVIARQTVTDNLVLNVVLIVALLAIARFAERRTGGVRSEGRVLRVLLLAFIAVQAVIWIAPLVGYHSRSLLFLGLSGLGAVLLLAAILLTAQRFVDSAADRWLLWVAGLSVIVLVAPLAVVSPLGPRCFYPVYLIMLVIVSVAIRRMSRDSDRRLAAGLQVVSALGLIGLILTNLVVYGTIASVAATRLADIRAGVEAGRGTVTVARLPFEGWVHAPDPARPPWDERYKLFYGLPPGLVIRVR